ncbi:MAG: hypothetical protein V4668_03865 [Patescibacteria group bacterium]
MKKIYLIIAGVIAILLLVAIWLYLLIYGTPKPVEQFFTDFTFSGTGENIPFEPSLPPLDPGSQVDVTTAKLRQLTIKPIIGLGEHTEGEDLSRISYIRYAETGTGHIFSINIITGEEKRISNATIAGASKAVFSPNGKYVAIASGNTTQNTVTLITLTNNDTATTQLLSQKMVDFNFSATNELRYTEYSSSGLTGRSLNPDTLVGSTIFTIPFQSATVIWNTETNSPNYVYPKTSTKLPGYLYSLSNGSIKRLNVTGNALTVEANKDYYVSTQQVGEKPSSFITKVIDKKISTLPLIMEPSKCVFSTKDFNILYCGYELTEYSYEFPDNWYKGLISFSDTIWQIDVEKGSATQIVNPETETGRAVDITNMSIGSTNEVLYFINKTDNTLWMYEI